VLAVYRLSCCIPSDKAQFKQRFSHNRAYFIEDFVV
jgi:hypothetical protein